jgi:hypothetical protein
MDFTQWLHATLQLQRESFGQDPPALEGDERADWLMMNFFAMNAEITEMSDECGWKPWTQPRGWINRDAMIAEAVDVMHFLANVLVTLDADITQLGVDLSEKYLEKVAKNRIRQQKGDDGVSRRCRNCRRSLDDVGIFQITHPNRGRIEVCAACRYPIQGP